jgi:tetratricopeptide (TPR) repeat protein
MKNKILIYTLITSSFSFNGWAQKTPLNDKKMEELQTNSAILNAQIDTPAGKVKYYHVEEIYPMNFGGHKTVYNVTNPKLIQTYNLGPNNKRVITPVFEKEDQLAESNTKSDVLKKTETSTKLSIASSPQKIDSENRKMETLALVQNEQINETAIKLESLEKVENSSPLKITDSPKNVDASSYIDIIKTYERVVEKGYETVDILKKLGNSFFFNNELEKAEKYYSKLFNKTTDLEPEYYYRYSVALRSKGQIEKADEYLKKFNQLSVNNTK